MTYRNFFSGCEDMEESYEEIQQGYLCTSAYPRRIGVVGGETIILSPEKLSQVITRQQFRDDQSWKST